jgi:hypothetical protein
MPARQRCPVRCPLFRVADVEFSWYSPRSVFSNNLKLETRCLGANSRLSGVAESYPTFVYSRIRDIGHTALYMGVFILCAGSLNRMHACRMLCSYESCDTAAR